MPQQNEVIDYSSAFPGAVLAQGSGSSFLVLYRLDNPVVRGDGKKASYQLNYRWLSEQCQHETDQSWACVMGAESTYWQRQELESMLRKTERGGEVILFNHFNID